MDSINNNFSLTERDFELIEQALKHLPSKDIAGDMLQDLLIRGLTNNEEQAKKLETELHRQRAAKKREADLLAEEILILRGRLLQFKRYLVENNLLSKVNEILK